jgi:uncharacterized protein
LTVKKVDAAGFSLLIVLASAGVECRVTYIRKEEGASLGIDALRNYLAEAGVRFGIDEEALASFCAGVAAGIPQEKMLLAHGLAPTAGQNGRLEFPAPAATSPPGEENDQALTVDLRNVKSLVSIKAGEVVARILPPVPGRPGTAVSGEVIPAPEVKPAQFVLGAGVFLEQDGETIVAETAGRTVFQDSCLSLSEEFVVKGNVDFKVGHIDFDGIVIVEGDVLDDFNIRAGKGLVVTGVIGACTIEAGGNVQICGMSGQGKGRIACKGIIFARYLNEVDIEVDGSVIVEKEILKSTIRATGVVMCDGHLAGGECIARAGIEAKTLGSGAGLATALNAGADYRDLAALTTLYRRLAELANKVATTGDLQLAEQKKALQKEVMALKTKQYDNANAKVNVQSRIEDQVRLTLGDTTQTLTDMKGPISIIENMTEGGFSILRLTPLDIKASVLRMEAVATSPPTYPHS